MLSLSDRSGLYYPYKDMVEEPDTKVWVHKSESDGRNNRVALAKRERVFMDTKTPKRPSERAPESVSFYATSDSGDILTTDSDERLIYLDSYPSGFY
jgi:hypothetical protein